MKVILQTDVSKLGSMGEVREVARGYARNYLIPKGLALEATSANLGFWKKVESRKRAQEEKRLESARQRAESLKEVSLSFSRAAGEQGKLFGSVGKADIAKSLKASGFEVEKAAIELPEPLKAVGDFQVEVRLHPKVSAAVKVTVVSHT